jgi:hypothetical protein
MKLLIVTYSRARPLRVPEPFLFDTESVKPVGVFGSSHSAVVEQTLG